MEGGYNFRDLGGIQTADGRQVAWGKLFRADDMHSLTERDLEYLASIPIKTVVDFRHYIERERLPDRLPGTVSRIECYNLTPGSIPSKTFEQACTIEETHALMVMVYELLVSEDFLVSAYRDFFRLLQEEDNLPLLFHCSAGKDRTGLAAALILFSLGVDKQTIMEDYLTSEKCLEGKYRTESYFFKVSPKFLEAGIAKMEQLYGSVENYLSDVLQVDLEKMRDLYLV